MEQLRRRLAWYVDSTLGPRLVYRWYEEHEDPQWINVIWVGGSSGDVLHERELRPIDLSTVRPLYTEARWGTTYQAYVIPPDPRLGGSHYWVITYHDEEIVGDLGVSAEQAARRARDWLDGEEGVRQRQAIEQAGGLSKEQRGPHEITKLIWRRGGRVFFRFEIGDTRVKGELPWSPADHMPLTGSGEGHAESEAEADRQMAIAIATVLSRRTG